MLPKVYYQWELAVGVALEILRCDYYFHVSSFLILLFLLLF